MSENVSLPRKVLMTADTLGGVWTYAIELARGLAERGVEVALATYAGAALARLFALGAREHEALQDVGKGIRVATVLDPFGNVLGIIENPHFKLEGPGPVPA